MAVIAMTQEMGSLGSTIGLEVARRLDYAFLRDDIIKGVARSYRVRETRVVSAVEERPRLLDRWSGRGRRYRTYLEAAVLEAAERDRVVLGGRWSTVFLRGVAHAVRIRVCAPVDVRAGRVMGRYRIDREEAIRRIRDYDQGVQARMRQMFDLDWTDSTLYDLVVNTERTTIESGTQQVMGLVAASEFRATAESIARVRNRALAARVRAALAATATTMEVEITVHADGGRILLSGLVASEEEQAASLGVAREVSGVTGVASELRVFRRPVR